MENAEAVTVPSQAQKPSNVERLHHLINSGRARSGRALVLGAATVCLGSSGVVHAQSDATAVQPLALSAFGMGTGTWTNVLGGRNLGITAGGDLSFLTYRKLRPVLEVRGNYPLYKGGVDDQRSFLGGLKVERQYGVLRPYVNFLIGRGGINYPKGVQQGNLLFLKTVSTVYSPGFGVEYDLTPQWAAKVDFQYQYWDTPAVTSGSIHPKAASGGVVYRFDFNHHYKVPRGQR